MYVCTSFHFLCLFFTLLFHLASSFFYHLRFFSFTLLFCLTPSFFYWHSTLYFTFFIFTFTLLDLNSLLLVRRFILPYFTLFITFSFTVLYCTLLYFSLLSSLLLFIFNFTFILPLLYFTSLYLTLTLLYFHFFESEPRNGAVPRIRTRKGTPHTPLQNTPWRCRFTHRFQSTLFTCVLWFIREPVEPLASPRFWHQR